jgi:hypothetical protein
MAFGNFTFPAVTVGTSLVEILDFDVSDRSALGIVVGNTGATAFNAFSLQAKVSDEAAWTVLGNAAAAFSTPVFPFRRAVGTPVTLAGGATAMLMLDVMYVTRIRLQASVASGSTTAVVRVAGR